MYLRAGLCELPKECDFFFLKKTCISDGISTLFFLLCSSLSEEVFKLNKRAVQGDFYIEINHMEKI